MPLSVDLCGLSPWAIRPLALCHFPWQFCIQRSCVLFILCLHALCALYTSSRMHATFFFPRDFLVSFPNFFLVLFAPDVFACGSQFVSLGCYVVFSALPLVVPYTRTAARSNTIRAGFVNKVKEVLMASMLG